MSNMEFNKIFAALLVAGLIAGLAGFVSKKLVYPKYLAEDAVPVEGAEVAASISAGPQMPEPILAMLADADITRGERLSRACTACHSFTQGGPHGTGPNLWNKINAPIGKVSGFNYSTAMAELGGEWTYEQLNWYLWRPRTHVPGTIMNYIGIRNPQDRAALIAWMRTLSDSPASLPDAGRIATEEAELSLPEDDLDLSEDSE